MSIKRDKWNPVEKTDIFNLLLNDINKTHSEFNTNRYLCTCVCAGEHDAEGTFVSQYDNGRQTFVMLSGKAHLHEKHWTLIYSIYTHIHVCVSRNQNFHLIGSRIIIKKKSSITQF